MFSHDFNGGSPVKYHSSLTIYIVGETQSVMAEPRSISWVSHDISWFSDDLYLGSPKVSTKYIVVFPTFYRGILGQWITVYFVGWKRYILGWGHTITWITHDLFSQMTMHCIVRGPHRSNESQFLAVPVQHFRSIGESDALSSSGSLVHLRNPVQERTR